jgi:hypothetical protein
MVRSTAEVSACLKQPRQICGIQNCIQLRGASDQKLQGGCFDQSLKRLEVQTLTWSCHFLVRLDLDLDFMSAKYDQTWLDLDFHFARLRQT